MELIIDTINKYVIYRYVSPSGKSYIGQTNNLKRRAIAHKDTKNNKCVLFCNAIQKYGFDNFTCEILAENLSINDANIQEVQFIKQYNTIAPNGYNLTTGGLNWIPSFETRQKMSIAGKNKIVSEETIRKRAIANKGKIRSITTKQKISVANTGKVRTQEQKQRMSISHQNQSIETRLKMSITRTGRNHSEETKQKMSIAKKGVPLSVQHRENLSIAKKGCKCKIDVLTGKRSYYFPDI